MSCRHSRKISKLPSLAGYWCTGHIGISKDCEELELEPIGLASIRTVGDHQTQVEQYRMSVAIPVSIGPNAIFGSGGAMSVLLLPYQPESHDVLLGYYWE